MSCLPPECMGQPGSKRCPLPRGRTGLGHRELGKQVAEAKVVFWEREQDICRTSPNAALVTQDGERSPVRGPPSSNTVSPGQPQGAPSHETDMPWSLPWSTFIATS